MSHHEVTGKPLLQLRVLGMGLAGSVLAELMLIGATSLGPAGLAVTARQYPPDQLQHQVLDLILGEQIRHPVREWLQFLSRTVTDDVAHRLELAGYLHQARGQGLWRKARWVPADPNWAFAPLLRIRAALSPHGPPSEYGAVLAGMAAASGLGFRIEQYAALDNARGIAETNSYLKPALRELIAETQAAADSALLSHRG